jgi:hypothetical protein
LALTNFGFSCDATQNATIESMTMRSVILARGKMIKFKFFKEIKIKNRIPRIVPDLFWVWVVVVCFLKLIFSCVSVLQIPGNWSYICCFIFSMVMIKEINQISKS